VEIGDNIEVEETGSDEETSDSAPDAPPLRRKTGRNGGKGRTGKRIGNGNLSRDGEREISVSAGDGRTRQSDLRSLLAAMRNFKEGDFNVQLPVLEDPLLADIADEFNAIAKLNTRMCDEMNRVSKTIGRQGQMNDRVSIGPVAGGWRSSVDSVNTLITDLASPTTEIARVLAAVADGDLKQKMVLEIDGKSVQGEFLRIATTVNTMVDQLGSFADEVTRVARAWRAK